MKIYFVGAGPGDPELLTRKAERLLRQARVCIFAGSLVSPEVLSLLPPGAERHDSAAMTLPEIIAVCVKARAGDVDVVRLHSGEPCIYGAIAEQMEELDRLGIEYEVVPGISSFQAAAALLRAELTAPDIAQTVILTRVGGRTPVPETQELAKLAQARATLCIFLSAGQVEKIVGALLPDYGADCPAAIVYRATWPDQQVIRTRLAELPGCVQSFGLHKTAIILVGKALERSSRRSRLYDEKFSHEFRKATS